MPAHFELAAGAVKDGWFTTRPVLFTVEYEIGLPWEKAPVLYCEGLIDKVWHSLA
jgi:hypothetical protein